MTIFDAVSRKYKSIKYENPNPIFTIPFNNLVSQAITAMQQIWQIFPNLFPSAIL